MRIRISGIFEISKYLVTDSGKELRGALEYLSQFCQQVIQVLTEKLTYKDNFLCEIRTIDIISGVPAIVSPSKQQPVSEIRIRRIFSDQHYAYSSFGWTNNTTGQVLVYCELTGSPAGTFPAEIIIYY